MSQKPDSSPELKTPESISDSNPSSSTPTTSVLVEENTVSETDEARQISTADKPSQPQSSAEEIKVATFELTQTAVNSSASGATTQLTSSETSEVLIVSSPAKEESQHGTSSNDSNRSETDETTTLACAENSEVNSADEPSKGFQFSVPTSSPSASSPANTAPVITTAADDATGDAGSPTPSTGSFSVVGNEDNSSAVASPAPSNISFVFVENEGGTSANPSSFGSPTGSAASIQTSSSNPASQRSSTFGAPLDKNTTTDDMSKNPLSFVAPAASSANSPSKTVFAFNHPGATTMSTAAVSPNPIITPSNSETADTNIKTSFQFGAPSGATIAGNESTKPSFSFGTSAPADNNNKASFSFGTSNRPTPDDNTVKTSSGFGTPSSTTTTAGNATKPSFTFGSSSSSSSEPAQNAIKPSSSGAPTSTTAPANITTKPSFTFGTPSSTFSSADKITKPVSTFDTPNTTTMSRKDVTTPHFSFGATSSTSAPADKTTKPSFSFGAPSSTAASQNSRAIPSFSFGTPSSSSSQADETTKPSFSFGAPSSTSASEESATKPSFIFGAPSSTPAPAENISAPSFSFGAPSSASTPVNKTTTASFSFGTPSTTAAPDSSATKPSFSFGVHTGDSTTTSNTTKSSITFGGSGSTSTRVDGASKPTFSFGAPSSSSAPAASAAKPSFSFGAHTTSSLSFNTPASTQSTTVASKPAVASADLAGSNLSTMAGNKSLSFNTSMKSSSEGMGKPSSTFTFGSSPAASLQSAETASKPGGPQATESSQATKPAPTHSYWLRSLDAPQSNGATSTKPSSQSEPLSRGMASQPVFSFSSSSTSATTSPSAAPTAASPNTAKKNDATSNMFTFSSSTGVTATPASVASPFSFSATSTGGNAPDLNSANSNADKKGNKHVSFALPLTTASTSINGTSAAASSTPGGFSLSSTVAPAANQNVFSFTKLLEDMEKIASQPPSQINASLMTPALMGLQQNQIVTTTNFRIDNILATTRFSELPEEAQKELDQLHQYIRLESQRCDSIVKHGAKQQLNAIEAAQAQTDSLIRELGALSSNLKGQIEATERLFDKSGSQLRHAGDASSVIEACKNPGSSGRWLFGYGTDDDYFANLTHQLRERLEHYKRTVWEIERTVESWSKHNTHTPQDIGRIMREQNHAFIALANRVALLEEHVKRQKERHIHHQKIYARSR